ncbi:MAG: YbaN family protein [Anaerovoracaceae bacterium]
MKKVLYLAGGSISLVLAVIGIFLPLLPTTPLLLLTAFCYLRSSRRLYCWLMRHPVLGRYIYQYMENGAISTKSKIIALVFLWTTILLAVYFVSLLWLRILLPIVALCVTIHIARLKRTTSQMDEQYLAFINAGQP